MMLILGAGLKQRIDGAAHQDIIPAEGIEHVFDLNLKTWPLSDNSFDTIVACHVIEHLESLINFMDECHRILRKDGKVYIETPNAGVNPDLTHCDPTHIRCYRPFTFHNYFTEYGIAQFGYTNKPWVIIEVSTICAEVPNDVIIARLTPLK